MNVSLTPELEKKVRDLVESGLYASASEVVRDALRTMPVPMSVSERRRMLDDLTQEAIAEVDMGLARELTPEIWDEIIAESNRIIAVNEPIPWYISGEPE